MWTEMKDRLIIVLSLTIVVLVGCLMNKEIERIQTELNFGWARGVEIRVSMENDLLKRKLAWYRKMTHDGKDLKLVSEDQK
jgi:hypothetical protein